MLIKIIANFPIIYQKDKVQYFCNIFAMMISKADHGESINQVVIMYSQLVKELIKWEKYQKNMIKGCESWIIIPQIVKL
jgi:sulfur transfer protein SufE